MNRAKPIKRGTSPTGLRNVTTHASDSSHHVARSALTIRVYPEDQEEGEQGGELGEEEGEDSSDYEEEGAEQGVNRGLGDKMDVQGNEGHKIGKNSCL